MTWTTCRPTWTSRSSEWTRSSTASRRVGEDRRRRRTAGSTGRRMPQLRAIAVDIDSEVDKLSTPNRRRPGPSLRAAASIPSGGLFKSPSESPCGNRDDTCETGNHADRKRGRRPHNLFDRTERRDQRPQREQAAGGRERPVPGYKQGGMNAKAYDVTGIDTRIRCDSSRTPQFTGSRRTSPTSRRGGPRLGSRRARHGGRPTRAVLPRRLGVLITSVVDTGRA